MDRVMCVNEFSMKGQRLTVCALGFEKAPEWRSPEAPDYEERDFTIIHGLTDDDLEAIIRNHNPHVFVTRGPWQKFEKMASMPLHVRRCWIDATNLSDSEIGQAIMNCYVHNVKNPTNESNPKITVFTAAYKTRDRILRPLASLKRQTYTNFEWVVVDDSPDQESYTQLAHALSLDTRFKVFKPGQHSGRIGEVKRWAASLSTGSFLVELDHDDELTSTCLENVVRAFQACPDAGFAYTDCAEVFEDGRNWEYMNGWGFGHGSYRDEEYMGKIYRVTNYPPINSKTVRHIVGMPNHVRAWRKSVYEAAGGHNPDVHVVDDYELMLRTFLKTRMIHIPRFGYIQYRNQGGGNQTFVRNREIQRLVRYFQEVYEPDIHARCIELGGIDSVGSDKDSGPLPELNYRLS